MKEESYETNFTIGWTSALLQGIAENQHDANKAFEKCACFHYDSNNMEKIIEKYVGYLDGFIEYISCAWGYRIYVHDVK